MISATTVAPSPSRDDLPGGRRRPSKRVGERGVDGAGLPPFVPNAEALAGGADVRLPLPRPRGGGGDRAAGGARRRRPLRRAPPAGRRRSTPSGTASSTRGRAPWSYGLPELFAPERPLVANPGCYATAALLALAPLAGRDRPGERRRRREVRRLGRRPRAEGVVARRLRAREPHAVPRRRRTSTRRRSSRRSASRSASSRTSCPCGAACSSRVTCSRVARPARAARGRVRRRRPACACSTRASTPELSRVQHTDAAEIALYEDRADGPRDRRLRDRQPRQGRRGQRRAERERRARARRDRGPAPDGSARMSVTAAEGLQGAAASPRGISKLGPDLALVAREAPASARGCSRRTASRPRPSSSARSTSSAPQPQAVVINSGNANAATGEQGLARRARDGGDDGAPARTASPSRCSSSRPA